MKRNLYIIILSLIALAVQADNRQGIDFFKAGEPTVASRLFEKQLNGSPADQAEALYYLGEIAYDTNKISEALTYYQKGWNASPDYAYNKIGEGKVLLKTDKSAAQKAFDTAIKVNKKDPPVYVAIAKAYLINGMEAEAQAALDNAKNRTSTIRPFTYMKGTGLSVKTNPEMPPDDTNRLSILIRPAKKLILNMQMYIRGSLQPCL